MSLQQYAQFAETVGEKRLDQTGTEALVQQHGFAPEDWQATSDGQPPYPVTAQQLAANALLGMFAPGSMLAVNVDPANPTTALLNA